MTGGTWSPMRAGQRCRNRETTVKSGGRWHPCWKSPIRGRVTAKPTLPPAPVQGCLQPLTLTALDPVRMDGLWGRPNA